MSSFSHLFYDDVWRTLIHYFSMVGTYQLTFNTFPCFTVDDVAIYLSVAEYDAVLT